MLYIAMMVECRIQPIFIAIMTFVITFGINPFVYHVDRNAYNFIISIFSALFTYANCLTFNIQLTYIATIRGKMRRLMLENFTLFNKMHEGLIVVSKDDFRI